MKKILVVLMCLVPFLVNAAAPAYTTVDGNYETELDAQTISAAAGFDTLVSADSTVLLSNFKPEPGWQYIIVHDAFTGTGSDSVSIVTRIDAEDGSGNHLYTSNFDAYAAAAGEAILLPIYGTMIGHRFDVTLISDTDTGTQLIINRVYLYRRRITVMKRNYR